MTKLQERQLVRELENDLASIQKQIIAISNKAEKTEDDIWHVFELGKKSAKLLIQISII